MAIKSLVTYFTPGLTPVKAKVEALTATHALVRVTERKNVRYSNRLLMLVPRHTLQVR